MAQQVRKRKTELELENDLFDQIIDLIEKTHWGKGRYYTRNLNGKAIMCSVGLIRQVNDLNTSSNPSDYKRRRYLRMHKRVQRALTKMQGYNMQVENWNDRSTTKREDVIALFKRAKRIKKI